MSGSGSTYRRRSGQDAYATRAATAGALLCALLAPAQLGAEPPWTVAMQRVVTQEARVFDGEIALVVEDLTTRERYTHNAATPSYLASGVKIVVLTALFEAIRAGKLRWDEEIVFAEADVRDGSHVLKKAKAGERFSVEQLTGLMMQHSDNAATDLLITRIGLEQVNQAAQRHGGPHFGEITSMVGVRRAIYGHLDPKVELLSVPQLSSMRGAGTFKARARLFAKLIGAPKSQFSARDLERAYGAYYDSGLNSAPLTEVARLLAAIERRELVDPEASQQMLEIMLGCKTGSRRIVAGVPKEAGLAHKTGTQYRRLCDLGIIYASDNRAILFAACLKEFGSSREAEALVARLASKAYSLIVGNEVWPPPPPGEGVR